MPDSLGSQRRWVSHLKDAQLHLSVHRRHPVTHGGLVFVNERDSVSDADGGLAAMVSSSHVLQSASASATARIVTQFFWCESRDFAKHHAPIAPRRAVGRTPEIHRFRLLALGPPKPLMVEAYERGLEAVGEEGEGGRIEIVHDLLLVVEV